MNKPKTIRSAASLILVTTALAWGLPARADDIRTLESEQASLLDTNPGLRAAGARTAQGPDDTTGAAGGKTGSGGQAAG
ncbi:MAG: hypothetical protein QHC78_11410 [Pigmentiphaga sp.]|uniref:hypothetical protein n=1 Tax=Pigmentiphaga sp. TaxID=1977564 RepID=UPI0029AE21FF|nr:hypothetical protein [Pigmentiphaga sp.]MDX3906287.1 hypothetical protein [Pigmentiphaga sp.]